jgi:hypothetical protein
MISAAVFIVFLVTYCIGEDKYKIIGKKYIKEEIRKEEAKKIWNEVKE